MNLNLFFRYVSASVAGMIALSCYILADTYLSLPAWARTASPR